MIHGNNLSAVCFEIWFLHFLQRQRLYSHIFLTGSCGAKTTSKYCCSLPFIYKGRRYNSCTRRKHNQPWCALTPNYDRDKKWANCASKSLEKHLSPKKSLFEVWVVVFFIKLIVIFFLFLAARKPVRPVKPVVPPPRGQFYTFLPL